MSLVKCTSFFILNFVDLPSRTDPSFFSLFIFFSSNLFLACFHLIPCPGDRGGQEDEGRGGEAAGQTAVAAHLQLYEGLPVLPRRLPAGQRSTGST